MRPKSILLKTLLCCLIAAAWPIQTQADSPAQAAGLVMTTEAAFAGNFRFGEWLPVFVTVENSGPDFEGEIRTIVSGGNGELEFALPAPLPAGARKQFTLYTLPNSFSRKLAVQLTQNESDQPLMTQEVTVNRVFNDRYVIGVVAADPIPLSSFSLIELPGRREHPLVLDFPLSDIPDRDEGLFLFNTLILNDVDTTQLTPDQQNALESWVLGGGRLILGGGSGAIRTQAGLPPSLLSVSPGQVIDVDTLPGLATYAGQPLRAPGPFLLSLAQPIANARVLQTTDGPAGDGLPLLVERSTGQGWVDFVALDLSQSPFDAWTGLAAFGAKLMSPGAAWNDTLPPDVTPRQLGDNQMAYALANLPALDLPSVRILGILLIGYILLVGPFNFLVLRWRDRLAWAWVTIPVLTLTFSGLAYGIGFSLRGSDIIVNQISVLGLEQDGRVSDSRTYVGVFSPSRSGYDIDIAGRSLIRPIGEAYNPWEGGVQAGSMSVLQGNPTRVRGLAINQWSMQSFVADTPVDQTLALDSDLQARRNRVEGTLINRSGQTWQDVIVLLNGQVARLGDLTPGQAAAVRLEFDEMQVSERRYGAWWIYEEAPGLSPRESNFKRTLVDSIIFQNGQLPQGSGPILIAWLNDSPLTVSVRGEEVAAQKRSFIHGALPLTFGGERVAVPPGFTRFEMLHAEGESGSCGPSGYFIGRGTLDLRLSLPEAARHVDPAGLDLYLMADGGWLDAPEVALYDRHGESWVPLPEAQIGLNPIQAAARYYDSETAALDVRLSRQEMNQGGCLFLELALEGEGERL